MVPADLSPVDVLKRAFHDEGLDLLGIAGLPSGRDEERKAAQESYQRWLAAGHHGSMTYLERHQIGKYDPGSILEGTRSVIVAGLGYYQTRPNSEKASGLVARYAWGRDYHKVVLKKLRRVADRLALLWPEERWKSFTDTAPLDERWWAARAGASFTARNSLAINRRLGSWFFLGEILTTKEFASTDPVSHQHGNCPSGCRRCHDICPTGALDSEGHIDAKTCISYLTIEHRGPIDEALKPAIGSWLFGCDLCQEVCPFNLAVKTTAEPEFLAWKAGPELNLEEILALDSNTFTVRFGGSPVHRAGRAGLVRNACLVAANLKRTDLLPRIVPLIGDADPGVADAARWARDRLDAGRVL
jgi:epoxyqueuosine reductase